MNVPTSLLTHVSVSDFRFTMFNSQIFNLNISAFSCKNKAKTGSFEQNCICYFHNRLSLGENIMNLNFVIAGHNFKFLQAALTLCCSNWKATS